LIVLIKIHARFAQTLMSSQSDLLG
jgi:hypothetical protein